jgi:hypothetical protein
MALPVFAAGQDASSKGEKPKDSPGWIVVEENIWCPWRYEPLDWFHDAEMHYRQSEEKSAAAELRKCDNWLHFAASHALPITKKSLDAAASDLKSLADDLDKGEVLRARDLDRALTKASQALAEWHYFNADRQIARNDERYAAENLQAAARYLRYAADSARYEYGDDFITTYEDLTGWTFTERVPNNLDKNLTVIKNELTKLGSVLSKSANTTS